jgi:hypothetical protein
VGSPKFIFPGHVKGGAQRVDVIDECRRTTIRERDGEEERHAGMKLRRYRTIGEDRSGIWAFHRGTW